MKDVSPDAAKLFEEEDPARFRKAAISLIKSEDADAWKILVEVLGQDDPWGFRHNAAVQVLGKLADPRATSALSNVFKTTPWNDTKKAVVQSLKRIGALYALLECISDESYDVRCDVVEALGILGDRRSVDPLVALLQTEDRWGTLHRTTALSLAKLQSETAIPALVQLLLKKGQLSSVKDGVFEALQSLGEASVGPLLAIMPVLDTSRESIAYTLDQLGHAKLAEAISRLFQADESAISYFEISAGNGDIRGLSVLAHRLEILQSDNPEEGIYIQNLLREAIARMYSAGKSVLHRYLCTKDLARFETHASTHGMNMLACRICGESVHVRLVDEVVAVLDCDMTESVVKDGSTWRVSWLNLMTLFDFDRVEIIRATDEAVVKLCMQIGNSTDRHWSRKTIPCHVDANCSLSDNTLQVLRRTFDTKSLKS